MAHHFSVCTTLNTVTEDLSLVTNSLLGSSQSFATPAPWDLTLSYGFCGYLHSCAKTQTDTYIKIFKNL